MKLYRLLLFAALVMIIAPGCRKKTNTPTYDFSFSAKNNFEGDVIEVHSTAPSGVTVKWNFGDNGIAEGQSATHKYLSGGNFTITMAIENSQILKKTINIAAHSIVLSAGPYYPYQSISFTSTASSSGHTFQWYFGDGATSTEPTPSHTYSVAGIKSVRLELDGVVNVNTQLTVEEYNILVGFAPPYYPGTSIGFACTAPAGSTYLWNFGDGITATDAAPAHTYAHSGHYSVSLVVNGNTLRTIYLPLDVSLYPSQASDIAGARLWRHISYSIFPDSSIMEKATLANVSFPVSYVSDERLYVGSVELKYTRSVHDSVLHYDGTGATLDYNIYTHATHYSTSEAYYPPEGHAYKMIVNDYDTP